MNGELSRRTFVQTLAGTPALLGAACSSLGDGTGPALEPTLLLALAEAVLPAELGTDGMAAAATAFREWVDRYDPTAELNHGYGTSDLAWLPPDPAPAWAAQLATLDREARGESGTPFAGLAVDRRRRLLGRLLDGDRTEAFPPPQEAGHVAIGLMAWFYATPQATDLCYRARIGKETCRDLGAVVDEPAPWPEGG